MPPVKSEELLRLRQQINNLARRYKRAAAAEERSSHVDLRPRRRRATSTRCLMVYILGGRSSALAVDFMLGRGQHDSRAPARKRGCAASQSSAEVVQKLTADIEEAFARAPSSAVAGLLQDPMLHFEVNDLLCAHKYVMEHNLCAWISAQNVQQGVAPSREHVLAQLQAQISAHAPEQVRERLCKLAAGTPRKQRKWLARYRRRWHARFGVLRTQEHVCHEEKQRKAGLIREKGARSGRFLDCCCRIVESSKFGTQAGSFWVQLGGPIFGSMWRTHFWARDAGSV